jgi:hypothetical protein
VNLKKFKEDYDKYDLSQKKETVTTMLKAILWKWDNFDNIYNFIIQNPDDVYENELDEVFWILFLWMYQDNWYRLNIRCQQIWNWNINIGWQEWHILKTWWVWINVQKASQYLNGNNINNSFNRVNINSSVGSSVTRWPWAQNIVWWVWWY